MGSNEEYLDKLLQSVTTGENPASVEEHKYSEDMTDDELLASLVEMYSEELAEFKTEEIIHKEESDTEEALEQISVPEKVQTESEIETESNLSLDDLLGANRFLENEFEGITVEEETVEDVAPEETYTSTESDHLSQSDIEALLNNLQDDLSQTSTGVVNEEKIIDDFSKEEDPVLEEILSEPQIIEEQDADILIRDLDTEDSLKAEDNLLKEMGIESMSAEQIDELLNEAAAAENPEDTFVADSNEMNLDALFGGLTFADDFDPDHKASEEMADLLGGMLGGGDDLAEINNLLQQADNHENVDDSNLRNMLNMDEDIGGNDLLNELLQAETGITETAKTDDKKEKKQKVKKEKQPKEKKEGTSLWNKLTSILFEEEDDLDDDKVKIVDGDGLANLIDASENDAILAEMMSEDKQKGKKSKKKDKGKDAKNKKNNAKSEDGEEVIDPKEQAKLEKQKQKAEKQAAKKKAKEEKAEADRAFLKAQPSISTKRAMVAFAFAITLMAVILIIYIFVPDAVEKSDARKAYYDKDYYEAFELLQGKDLNDSDTILLNKVTCILKMQRKLDSYNNYVKMGKELEALNALVEAVRLYGENYTYASALSIDDEYNAIYDEIKIILNGKYGVSEERAKEILAYESDAQYTISLRDIIDGKTLNTPGTDDSKKPLEDVLPEEEDFLKGQ